MKPNNDPHKCWACGNPEVTVAVSVTYRPGKDEIIVGGWDGKAPPAPQAPRSPRRRGRVLRSRAAVSMERRSCESRTAT